LEKGIDVTDEQLLRLCYLSQSGLLVAGSFPHEVDATTQKLLPDAISKADLKERGWSVQREHLYSRELSWADLWRRRANNPMKRLLIQRVGFLGSATLVQEKDEAGESVFLLRADGGRLNPAHASVYLRSKPPTGWAFSRARLRLIDLIGETRSCRELKSGNYVLALRLLTPSVGLWLLRVVRNYLVAGFR
jgi:hypothetical protein